MSSMRNLAALSLLLLGTAFPGASLPDAEGSSPRRDAVAADDGSWIEMLPSGRFGHTAIYDPVRDRMIVFGGTGSGLYKNDLWSLTLSGTQSWNALAASGTPPTGRHGHSAIYDPIRDRIVIFGGFDGSRRNDVWALSLSGSPAWSAIIPSGSPPSGRSAHTAIYDPVRDRMVVFGGHDGSRRNDVWTLSLSGNPAWSELTPSGTTPPARSAHTAIYDRAIDRMVIFGGTDASPLNDVWGLTLSGAGSWSSLSPSGTPPPGMTGFTAIYDSLRAQMLVFGGIGGVMHSNVWVLSLSGSPTWSEPPTTGGASLGRFGHSAIYDPGRDRMVMFGGYDGTYRSDAWALSLAGSGAWSVFAPSGGPLRRAHTAIYDALRSRMIVFGGLSDDDIHNDVRALSLSGSGSPTWSALNPSGSAPPARYGHSAIYDPAGDRMVVFGGYDGSGYRNDVWALTLSGSPAWSMLTPFGSPPPGVSGHTAIFDPVRGRMVVFGGYDGALPYRNDVWTLTLAGGPAWSALAPSGSPPTGRGAHSAFYDPVRDRMVVFGGDDGGPRNDVWALILSGLPAWSALGSAGSSPVARSGHTAIYDTGRDRMVMFGGYDGSYYHNDVWALALGTPSWTALAATGSPPWVRSRHTAIHDTGGDRMVVFAGTDGILRNDVWALDWTPSVVDVAGPSTPSRLVLHPARPNPAFSAVEVRYEVADAERVNLDVLDIQGRITRRLRNGIHSAGSYSVKFDSRDDHGRHLPPGIYLIRLGTRDESRTTRIVVLP